MNKVRGSEVFPPTVIETRSTKYKSAALSQISEIYLVEKKYSDAISYAKESLNYNRLNLNALEIYPSQDSNFLAHELPHLLGHLHA